MAWKPTVFNKASLEKDFDKILKNWVKIHDSYGWNDEDPLYWYNERANVGTFAGAVWKSGFYAMEEFRSKKSIKEGKKKAVEKNGRVDLWIFPNDVDYIVEAKEAYPSMVTVRDGMTQRINDLIGEAVKDAGKSVDIYQKGVKFLGLAFVVPTVSKTHHTNYSELLEQYKQDVSKVDCDFHAHWFNSKPKPVGNEEYAHPGISVFGKLVKV